MTNIEIFENKYTKEEIESYPTLRTLRELLEICQEIDFSPIYPDLTQCSRE